MRRQLSVRARARELARRRALASDVRAGSYARDLARRKQYAFAKRQWRLLVLVVFVFSVVPAPFLWFVPQPQLRAFAAGALVASGIWCAWWMVVQLTGTASTMAGALGEQWSASELRKLSKRGWRVVNHIVLRHHDIDHVAIGPGGVLVLETKWASDPWAWDGPYLTRTITRVQKDVLSLQGMIQSRVGRGAVHGAIVIWGAGLEETPAPLPREVAGVSVCDADSMEALLDNISAEQRLTADDVHAVWEKLAAHIERRDIADAARAPRPLSPAEVALRVASGFAGAMTALVLPALASRLPGSALASASAAALLALAGWAGRSLSMLRWFPHGLVVGGEFWLVLVSATYVLMLTPLL